MHIVEDGAPVRILGAWVGNKIDAQNIWNTQIEKIDNALAKWERSHPTMEGRKLIVQLVIGGMTQYLTQVQGMPPKIERKLSKRARLFMWSEKM